jgi:type II secretory pathway pseudopilin PulG
MTAGEKAKNRDRPRFSSRTRIRNRGFTYLALLLVVAATGGVLAAAGELHSRSAQREREAELLFAGAQIRHAIGEFYDRSPGGVKRYPAQLEDLLEDRRHPVVQRHLRRLYPDPMTGRADWQLIEAPGGGIMGVHSRSALEPIRRAGFAPADESFAQAASYADWKFFHTPPPSAAAGR